MLLLSPQMDAVVGKLEDIQSRLLCRIEHNSKELKRQAEEIERNKNEIESLKNNKKPRTEKGMVLIISKLVKLCKISVVLSLAIVYRSLSSLTWLKFESDIETSHISCESNNSPNNYRRTPVKRKMNFNEHWSKLTVY